MRGKKKLRFTEATEATFVLWLHTEEEANARSDSQSRRVRNPSEKSSRNRQEYCAFLYRTTASVSAAGS